MVNEIALGSTMAQAGRVSIWLNLGAQSPDVGMGAHMVGGGYLHIASMCNHWAGAVGMGKLKGNLHC